MPRWRRENTRLVYYVAGMLVLPWIMLFLTVPPIWAVLTQAGVPANYWLGAVLMGAVWFFGIAFYGMGAT